MRRPEGGKAPTRLGRVRRRLGFDRNEMRRRVDRVQWTLGLVLSLVFLLAAPATAVWAGNWSYDSGTRVERQEQASRRQVVATVTGPGARDDRYLHQTVRATWQAPDGTMRTGQIPAWKDARAGTHHTIWVGQDGQPTVRPRPHSRTLVETSYAVTGAVLAAGLPLLVAYCLIRRRCDRVRDAMWDAEWARIDPHRIS